MPEAPVARLAAAIETLVRAHKAATPAPRGLQYLGLERASGTGFHLLDALAARGIFRKYELVLDVGAGLGGTSRWLAARLGCGVVCTAASPAEAEAREALPRPPLLPPPGRDPRRPHPGRGRQPPPAAPADGPLRVVQLVARRPGGTAPPPSPGAGAGASRSGAGTRAPPRARPTRRTAARRA